MKGSKRPAKKAPGKGVKIEFAGGDRCVYCGSSVRDSDKTVVIPAKVRTRSFPVCSEACREGTEHYVTKDLKLKMYLYLLILAAAVCIILGALSAERQQLMYVGIGVAGAAFLAFPYPISIFETFQQTPIRTVTWISRGIGAALLLLSAVFLLFA